jgi:hypothetical protein
MGLVANTSLTIEVLPRPNRPPVIMGFKPVDTHLEVEVDQKFPLEVQVWDEDGDVIMYKWFVDGVEIANATGKEYIFGSGDTGIYTVTVEVTDGKSDPLTTSWTVRVRKTPTPVAWIDANLLLAVAAVIIIVVVVLILALLFLRRKEPVPYGAPEPVEEQPPPEPAEQEPMEEPSGSPEEPAQEMQDPDQEQDQEALQEEIQEEPPTDSGQDLEKKQ